MAEDTNTDDDDTEPGLLRLIVESAADFAIFTMDVNGIATSWNVGAERLLGFSRQEILGQSIDVIFPPEEGGAAAAEEERRIAVTNGRAEDERWHRRKDGTRLWASGLLMPLAQPERGFAKILRDRTVAHELELRLKASEEMFRILATNVPQLVFRTRAGGERTWGSPQWSVFTGLDFSRSLGLGWLDAVHPDDRDQTQDAWQAAAVTGEYYVEHRLRRASDGEFRWHQTRARPLATTDGEALEWIGTSTEIHDLKSLEGEQRVLVAELQHRTKNLLALIHSLSRHTSRSAESLPQFQSQFESRLRALGRVQSLLSRTRTEEVDLRELIQLELEAHGDDDATPGRVHIEGPAAQLPSSAATPIALAIHELATNAVKYGAIGRAGAMLLVTWQVEPQGADCLLHLLWQERGVPIRPDPARRKGYGMELIERALPYQLGARTRIDFTSDGLRCEVDISLGRSARGDDACEQA